VFGVDVGQVLQFYMQRNYDLNGPTLTGREEHTDGYTRGQRMAVRIDYGIGDVVYYLHRPYRQLATSVGPNHSLRFLHRACIGRPESCDLRLT
jgi:hypothetical protein